MECVPLWEKFEELGCNLVVQSPGDVNWMGDVPSMKPFINWFQEYISADNVLNYGELEEYKTLCDAGDEVHGEALDEALRRAGFPTDDVPVEAFDLLEEKDEIHFLKEQIETLTCVEERLQSSLKKEQEAELLLHDEQKATFKEGQVLMKLSVNIKSSLANFFQNLQQLTTVCLNYNNTDTCHFLAQGPLEDFLSKCDTFEQNMKIFIKRQFDRKELSGKSNIETLSNLINEDSDEREDSSHVFNNNTTQGELKIHPKTLWEAEVRRVCALAKLRGLQAAIQNIESLRESLDKENIGSALRLLSVNSPEDCSVLETETDLVRQHELSTAARDLVVAKIAAIAEDTACRRSIRRRYRLNKLKTLEEVVTRHVLLTDVLWLLLRREKKLVNLAALFVDDAVTTLIEEHTKHLAVMELHQAIQQKHEAFQKLAAKGEIPLVASLNRMMGIEEKDDIAVLVDAIQDLLKRVEQVDQTLFMGQVLDPLNLAMEKSLKCLEKSLCTGQTRQPLLIPSDILQKLDFVGKSIEELEKEINRLERNFSSKQELFTKFPIQRGSQLLWAWFLAAPAQLFAALKRAEQAVKNERRTVV